LIVTVPGYVHSDQADDDDTAPVPGKVCRQRDRSAGFRSGG